MGELLKEPACFDLDCIFVRHPLAQGLIPFASGVIWTFFWGLIALVGAALLNPVCAILFVIGAILEVVYCRLYKVSQWKILIAATVKNLGALAAIFAVNPKPQPQLVVVVFIWIALWEVGGQNIPNDLVDMQEDGRLGAKTIPVVYGPSFSVTIVFAALIFSDNHFCSSHRQFCPRSRPDLSFSPQNEGSICCRCNSFRTVLPLDSSSKISVK
jgi:4-hydroxybenzoate polyprenyltransferase